MPNGAPPRLLLTDLATPAGTGIDVDKISSQLEQFAWQGCQALSGAAQWVQIWPPRSNLAPNLRPRLKIGPQIQIWGWFGPRGPNLGPGGQGGWESGLNYPVNSIAWGPLALCLYENRRRLKQ